MTIEEMIEFKVETEQKIGDAMTEFCQKTGLQINNLSWDKLDVSSTGRVGPEYIYKTEIEVKL